MFSMAKKVVIIAAVAVAAIVVGGGVAAILLSGNSNNSNSIDFDKRYFDLSGAKSLVVMKESSTTGSQKSTSVSIGSDSNGAAKMPLGDNTGDKSVLYKKNELGEYVKVKLYETKEGMDSNTGEIQNDFSVVSMDVSDNGKYAYMIMGIYELSHDGQHSYYNNIKSIVVSIETGKIYQLVELAPTTSMMFFATMAPIMPHFCKGSPLTIPARKPAAHISPAPVVSTTSASIGGTVKTSLPF